MVVVVLGSALATMTLPGDSRICGSTPAPASAPARNPVGVKQPFKLTDPAEDWSDDALIAFLTDEKNRRCQPTLLRVVDYYKPALFGVSRFTLEQNRSLRSMECRESSKEL